MVATTEGERYDVKHRPKVIGDNPYCCFVLPSGQICNRLTNRVYRDLEFDQSGTDRWVRHNPRPYRNY